MADNGRAPRQILHTADFQVRTLGDQGCADLEAVIKLASGTKPDLLIIAGDLFDSNRVKNDAIEYITSLLRRLSMPTVILPGNHDCLTPDSVYIRPGLWQDNNLHIFRAVQGEIFTLPDLYVALWGKPIATYEGNIHPMEGIHQPERKDLWNIGIAHGYYVGSDTGSRRSLQITEQDIASSGQDYIALGHWALFDCVSDIPVKAYYCGSPSPTGIVAMVELDEKQGVQVNRLSIK